MDPSSIDGWNKIEFGEEDEDEEKIGGWCFPLEPSAVERYSEVVAQRSGGPDLMQNCDLPPPLKIFAGPPSSTCPSYPTTTRKISEGEGEDDKFPTIEEHLAPMAGQCVDQKLDLLKALQLSQTRARAAEKTASLVKQDVDVMTTLLLKESSRLFAHRQWVKVLELEVSQLQSDERNNSSFSYIDNKLGRRCEDYSENDDSEGGGNTGSFTWYMTLAVCFGIASVGIAFGCRCVYSEGFFQRNEISNILQNRLPTNLHL